MPTLKLARITLWRSLLGLSLLAACVLTMPSCKAPYRAAQRGQVDTRSPYWPKSRPQFYEAQLASLQVPMPQVADAEYVNNDQLCMVCHETYTKTHKFDNVHREQACEKCHGPASRHLATRGQEPGTLLSFKRMTPPQRAEVCLQCHEENQCEPGVRWRTSVHAHAGVACTDCHTSHYNVPPGTPPTTAPGAVAAGGQNHQLIAWLQDQPQPDQESVRRASRHMGAIAPQVCYRCHASMAQYEQVAHPHQMLGPNSFTCATCHDPHGKIRVESRTDLCLQCHKGAPTMAWHSSTHSLQGVACTDCHNPHPDTHVQQWVNISHTTIRRPKRMPMSVDEPFACYTCHPKIYAENSLPSHHPIKEGKMVCSDCHDGHGQAEGNLREVTTNLVCYRCHAEKQGPFVWEHPPVTQDCGICHNPHGTVANNLLRQPPTFLCLRCHAGHRGFRRDIDVSVPERAAFYTNCTQCHSQVHGSDLPAVTRTPRLTR